MEETGLAFRPFIEPAALAAVAVVLAALSIAGYRRTSRSISGGTKFVLLTLRFAAIAVLLLCLLRPSLEIIHHEISKRPLVFLVDRSGSMLGISDTASGASRFDAINALLDSHAGDVADLEERYELIRAEFARGLLTSSRRGDPGETRYSAYGLALEQAAAELAGGRSDAIVIFGDGSHNLGPPDPVDVAAAVHEQGVPIYTIGVGQDAATSQLRDVKMLEVAAPRSVPLFTSFPVRARILCRGCQDQQVSVRVDFPGMETQWKEVGVSHAEEIVPLEFNVVPEAKGEFKATVRAEPLPGELLDSNNTVSTFVKVVSEGLSVGFFDVVRPESKFVTHSLAATQQLLVRRVLVLPGDTLPEPQTDPERYEVMIIGNIPPSGFPAGRIDELKTAVQDEGKGLIVLVGEDGWDEDGWQTTALRDVLPVQVSGAVRRAPGKREFHVVEEHAAHAAIALGADAAETLEIWSDMPALAGAFVGLSAKRGATVLAQDQDGNPLLVVLRSGRGRVACLLVDSTFRWFFTEQETQDHHRRFWRQLALWASGAAEKPETRVRVEPGRQLVLVDESLAINVKVTGAEEKPIADAELSLTVTGPDGHSVALPCTFSRREGFYTARYSSSAPGDHTVAVKARREGVTLGEDRALFHVSDANPELEDPIANLKLLRRISAVTEESGGRYFSYLQADELFRELKARGEPVKLTMRQRKDIWDSWPFFAVFAALMGAEWVLRKWKGLI